MVSYDIDNDLSSNLTWTAVGVAGNTSDGFYSDAAHQFNGLFITHKYYNNPTINTLNMDNACTISGLHTNGLFTNINSAYFTYIKFGNMSMLENSGVLGVNVGTNNEDIEQTTQIITIANVTINGELSADQENTSEPYLGGLFGTITEYAGTIKIYNLNTSYTDTTDEKIAELNLVGDSTTTRAGLLAGKMDGGTIIFTEPSNQTTNNLYVRFTHAHYGGGLIGEMTGGTIIGVEGSNNLNSTVYLFSLQPEGTTEVNANLGGIVGLASSSGDKSISNIDVIVPNMLHTNSFGGLIAEVRHDITFTDCVIDSGNSMQVVSKMNQSNNYFGLLAAKLGDTNGSSDATLTVDGFAYKQIDTDTTSDSKSILVNVVTNDGQSSEGNINEGFGLLIGRQNANFELTFDTSFSFEPNMIVSDGNNVGGLIGRYDSGYVKIDISNMNYSVQLSGADNVGGAIGYVSSNIENIFDFAPDETAEDDSHWNFLTDGDGNNNAYATVYKAVEQNIGRDLENWGGLFGHYAASELELYSAGNDENGQEQQEKLTITNYNNVYITFKENNTTQVIRNVGGVAGKIDNITEVSDLTNEGIIAFVNDRLDINTSTTADLYMGLDTDNEMFAIEDNSEMSTILTMNVGGVVGLLTSSANSDTSIDVSNIFNSANIEGYQNVGGLIGYAANISIVNNIYEEVSATEQLEPNQVYFTYDEGESLYTPFVATESTQAGAYYKLREGAAVEGQISGVLNVGGAFGYVTGTVDSIWSYADVYGNANVGGLIGVLNDAFTTVKNCAVMPTADDIGTEDNNVIIKGIYFIKRQDTISSGPQETYNTYFMPNSVGGLIGFAAYGRVQNNLVYDAFITSSSEGIIAPGASRYSGSSVINTIENNMVNISLTSGSVNTNNTNYFSSTNIYKYITSDEDTSNVVTQFDDMTSGFGGFIGTLSSSVALAANTDNSSEIYIESNSLKADIQAELGINVGTFYGYYYLEGGPASGSTGTSRYIVTPTLMGDTNVSGAYNIGGVVGVFDGGEQNTLENFNTNEIAGSGNITVQAEGVGMYVGGLIGKLKGDADTLRADSSEVNITLKTDSSYYIGGLIGRLEGNLKSAIGQSSSDNITVDGDAVNEFGGLVGMLKVETVSEGTTATVHGTHKYAFTVNTIENSNYFDGQSNFTVNEADHAIYLIAQAYYINLDTFNISSTSVESWYNVNATNPLDDSAQGWHKDYTGFKRIQRNIPMEENNGASWDSIAEIYDASRITHVGTIANLGLSGVFLPYEESYTNEDGTTGINQGTKPFDDNYICFTVYEQSDGVLMLYSAMGIGELFYNLEGETLDDDGNYLVPENGDPVKYNEFGGSTKLEKGQWIDANNASNGLQGLTYFTYASDDKWEEYITVDGRSRTSYQITATSTDTNADVAYVVYNVNEYLGDNNNTPYFVFTVMYANDTLKEIPKNDDVEGEYKWNNASILPKSGSIFEVYGFNDATLDMARYNEIVRWWEIVAEIFTNLAMIIPFINVAASAAKAVKVIVWVTKAVIAVVAIVFNIISAATASNDLALKFYFSITDQNFGYIASTYSRDIMYVNGEVSGQLDGILYVEDHDYQHLYTAYSSVRPSDYYSHYYFYLDKSGKTQYVTIDGLDRDNREVSITPEGEYSYIYTFTIGNQEFEGYLTYYYQNSMYYKNAMALSVEYVRAQDFFSTENYRYTLNVDEVETIGGNASTWYSMNNGYYYTYGSYLGEGVYSLGTEVDTEGATIAADPNNNLKYNNGTYTINGKNLPNNIVAEYQSENRRFVYNKDINETVIFQRGYKLGYDYIQGVYYTINGSQVDSNKKYAKYTLVENPSGLTSDGINYIQIPYHYTDAEGNPQTTTVWYQFSGPASSEDNAQEYLDLIENGLISTPDSLTITAYPSSFVNPYTTGTVGDLYAGEEIYINRDTWSSGGNVEINQDVTYYYFDGGYMYHDGRVFGKTSLGSGGILDDMLDEEGKEEDQQIDIKLYTLDGRAETVNVNRLIELIQGDNADDYYLLDPKTLEDASNYTLAKQYYYDTKTSSLYMWQSAYVVNSSYGYLEKGIMNPNNEGDYTVDYNYNKYLSNRDYALYTRYKYVNGSGQVMDLSGDWQVYGGNPSSYVLIPASGNPNFSGSPNGKTTYFVESVKVTLGGGVSLPLTGISNTAGSVSVTSGSIKIE